MFSSILHKLPVAVAAVLLIIAVFIIYYRSKNVTRSEFSRIFRGAKYVQAWMLVVVFFLSGFFGIFNHVQAKKSVSAVLTLNFSEASQAQNSNGTRYNMAEIICDDVIKRAIEMGGFEKVSVSDIKKCLSVYPLVQGNVQSENEYLISTEFVVQYNASRKTQHLDSENVLKLITIAYKEYYIENYTDNFKLDTTEKHPDFSKMEYMDIVAYFEKESTAILNYLYGLSNKSSSFVTKNNSTFNSIAGRVHQFRETQIEQNLKSLILQHGVVRDKVGYIDRLSYQNTNTDFDRRKNAISFNLCNQAIAMYSEEMTRIVLVPTWDNAGKYYMGRTKVGIDELSVNATSFSDMVASNEKEIMDNNLVIGKMQAAPANSPTHAEADKLIASIDENIKMFADEAIAAGREFSSYRMNQCIAVTIYGPSLFDELKDIIIFALFAYAAFMLFDIAKKFPERQ